MKLIFINITLFFTSILFLQACKKQTPDVFVPNVVQADTTWTSIDSITPMTLTPPPPPSIIDSLTVQDDDHQSINEGDSITVNFPKGGFLASNQTNTPIKVSTKIKTELLVIRSKGDLIKRGISTVARNGQLLAIGDLINMKITNKGNPVFWNQSVPPFQLFIKDAKPSSTMRFIALLPFSVASRDSGWGLLPQSPNSFLNTVTPYFNSSSGNLPKVSGYLFTSNNIGWFGSAIFIDSALPKTILNVFLPLTYTNKNTSVFAIFDNQKTVLLLKANPNGKSYSVPNVPINSKITFVSISKLNGDSYLGTSSIVATSSNPTTIVPYKKTMQEINQYLNGF